MIILYLYNENDYYIRIFYWHKLYIMGIDLIRGGRIVNRGHRETKTTNSYLKTLIKVNLR
jgi:hypothetical protein